MQSSKPRLSVDAAAAVLDVLQYAYPIVILFFFIFAFAAHSIASGKAAAKAAAKANSARKVQYGPGGKPLPVRSQSFKKVLPRDFSPSRKLVFEWLTVGVLLTYVGNATIVILHALVHRRDKWWCGEAVTVSHFVTSPRHRVHCSHCSHWSTADHDARNRSTSSAPSSPTLSS
jgi:hypothetical protein